jgi:hypothetical protein
MKNRNEHERLARIGQIQIRTPRPRAGLAVAQRPGPESMELREAEEAVTWPQTLQQNLRPVEGLKFALCA